MVSKGLLCLLGPGGSVYRYNRAGTPADSVGSFNTVGILDNLVGTSSLGTGFDVPRNIPGGVSNPNLLGTTWHFQLWHRDTPAGVGTSNFSNGLSYTF